MKRKDKLDRIQRIGVKRNYILDAVPLQPLQVSETATLTKMPELFYHPTYK